MYQSNLIAAFPATGKTFITQKYPNLCIDSDSSNYSWVKDENGNNTKVPNPEFPQNYINHIKENMGKIPYIFISSHEVVRNALVEAGIEFVLAYPALDQKEIYIERYKQRGSPQGFIDLVTKNWDVWLDQCDNQVGCRKLQLINGEFLIDRLDDDLFLQK